MESSLSSPPSSRVAAFIVRVKSRNGGGGIVDEGKAEEVCRIVALGIKADSNGETNKQKQMRYAASGKAPISLILPFKIGVPCRDPIRCHPLTAT